MELVDAFIPILAVVRTVSQTALQPTSHGIAPADPAGQRAPDSPTAVAPVADKAPSNDYSPFAPRPLSAVELTPAAQTHADSTGIATADDPIGSPGSADAVANAMAQRLAALIETARAACHTAQIDDHEFDAALFPVSAWCDETLIASRAWPGAGAWRRYLLQRRYLATTTAGVEFFERLERLDHDQHAVREIYAMCLSLGFKGRFAYENSMHALDEKRRATVRAVLADTGLTSATGQLLFPDAYVAASATQTEAEQRRRQMSMPSLVLFVTPVAILLVLFVVYHLIIGQMVKGILPLIK